MLDIILASKSKVRKKILDENNINCSVEPSKVDEETVKKSLLNEKASPEIISGDTFSLNKLFFTISSSTLDGSTLQ